MKLKALAFIVLLAIGVAVLFVDAPLFHPVPSRDSGGFLYIGQQMLKGQRLYADLFDDKPPGIYLINALGLLVSGGSVWGVWSIELISLLTTIILAYILLSQFTGFWPAVIAILLFIANLLKFLQTGNYTEEYVLPFQFLILVMVLPADLKRRLSWRAFVAGFAWGIVFFIKQNILGIGLAAGAFLFLRGLVRWRERRITEAFWYAAGFLALTVIVIIPFWTSGTLWNLWDATFLSNFAYVGNNEMSRLSGVIQTLHDLIHNNLFLAVSLGLWLALVQSAILAAALVIKDGIHWPVGVTPSRRQATLVAGGILIALGSLTADILLGKRADRIGPVQWIGFILGVEIIFLGLIQNINHFDAKVRGLLPRLIPPQMALLSAIAGLAYFLDILSISLSGKFFAHYYLIIFPTATILAAIFTAILFRIPGTNGVELAVRTALALALIPAAILPLADNFSRYHVSHDTQRQTVIAYVLANTQPKDELLMWGGEPVINFMTGRTRPNRFVFMSQLFLPGYSTAAQADEMLSDLKANPPKLIINSRSCEIPFLDYKTQSCVYVIPEWQSVYDYIRLNYRPVIDLGPDKWDVYEYIH
jgi:hypothetical protein